MTVSAQTGGGYNYDTVIVNIIYRQLLSTLNWNVYLTIFLQTSTQLICSFHYVLNDHSIILSKSLKLNNLVSRLRSF